MEQARVCKVVSLGLVLALVAPIWATSELKLGTVNGKLGQTVSVPLTLTNPDGDVQGVVFAAEWDATKVKGQDIVVGPAIAGADTIVPRIADGFAVLGVVMQTTMGTTAKVIPASSTPGLVATLKVVALVPDAGAAVTVPVTFADGKYNTTQGGPPLDNIIVIGANSIGKTDKDGQGNAKLVLTDGSITLSPPSVEGTFAVSSPTGFFGHNVSATITMTATNPVQGFVAALRHEAGITLASVAPSAVVNGLNPEFVQADVYGTPTYGGLLGIVMVLNGAQVKVIPKGTTDIGVFTFTSTGPTAADCPNGTRTGAYALTFADDLGDPVKPNVFVVNGQSIIPTTTGGTISLKIDPNDLRPICQVPPTPQLELAAGACGKTVLDPTGAINIPAPITATPGSAFELGVYYRFPESVVLDATMAADIAHAIQGMSIAMTYDATAVACLGTHSEKGTISEAVGVEYLTMHFKAKGDVGELVIGILVDAAPPFEGQYLPRRTTSSSSPASTSSSSPASRRRSSSWTASRARGPFRSTTSPRSGTTPGRWPARPSRPASPSTSSSRPSSSAATATSARSITSPPPGRARWTSPIRRLWSATCSRRSGTSSRRSASRPATRTMTAGSTSRTP